MSKRDLGDWSPLDRDSDPVDVDLEKVAAAQDRYEHISTTIDDAMRRLEKLSSQADDALKGKYADALREEATKLEDKLGKAGVRYRDVAAEIAKYEPDLEAALDGSALALNEARDAKEDQAVAAAILEPQPGEDGTVSPAEQQRGKAKRDAAADADDALAAAKNRLQGTLDDLDVAGTRFADAVTERNYRGDGLKDKDPWRLTEALKDLSKIFSYIGLALGAIGLFIPGLNAVALAGIAAGAVALGVNAKLYDMGEGSLADVIVGAVGLGFAGVAGAVGQAGKQVGAAARAGRGGQPGGVTDDIPLGPVPPRPPNRPPPPPPNRPPPPASDAPPPIPPRSPHRPSLVPPPLRPNRPPAPASDAPSVPPMPNRPPPPPPGTPTPPPSIPVNPASSFKPMSDFYNNPLTNWALGKGGLVTPEVGFGSSFAQQWAQGLRNFANIGQPGGPGNVGHVLAGTKGAADLAYVAAAAGQTISPAFYGFGIVNQTLNIGGIVYTSGRLHGNAAFGPVGSPPTGLDRLVQAAAP